MLLDAGANVNAEGEAGMPGSGIIWWHDKVMKMLPDAGRMTEECAVPPKWDHISRRLSADSIEMLIHFGRNGASSSGHPPASGASSSPVMPTI